jgi:hypothetical protein
MNRSAAQADSAEATSNGSPPGFFIYLPLEGRPRVHLVALHYEEEQRLRDWVESTGLVELVDRALELAAEEPAA